MLSNSGRLTQLDLPCCSGTTRPRANIFYFRRTTIFCLGKRLSKHKMTRYANNLGAWPLWPLDTPMPCCRTSQAKLLTLQTKCVELFVKRFLLCVIASMVRYFLKLHRSSGYFATERNRVSWQSLLQN